MMDKGGMVMEDVVLGIDLVRVQLKMLLIDKDNCINE